LGSAIDRGVVEGTGEGGGMVVVPRAVVVAVVVV